MRYLFFDTETTGLPRDWKAPMTQVDNWPRVLQLGWVMYDENQQLLTERCELLKPDGWTVPVKGVDTDSDFWEKHGYTTEKCMAEGLPAQQLFAEFIGSINQADYMIAHNMSYDYNVMGAEMIRYRMRADRRPEKLCTKELSTDYCGIPGRYGSYKWPSLDELHNHLFAEGFDGAHDALSDVRATARCFFELMDRKVILL